MNTIIFLLIAVSVICAGYAAYLYFTAADYPLAPVRLVRCKFMLVGFIAFILDTIGIGSFAPSVTMYRGLRIMPDELLPGALNMSQIVPGLFEALFFVKTVPVDMLTLVSLVTATCIGGLFGGYVVTHIKPIYIKLGMALAFTLLGIIVLINQLHLVTIAGHAMQLRGWHLVIAIIGFLFCGVLPAFGVGYYAIVGVFLFMLGLSPLAAFPIMTVACALQEPFTTIMLLRARKVPLKAVFYVSIAGCIGVAIAAPFVTHLNLSVLRWLLLAIVTFNALSLFKAYLKAKGQL